MQNTRPLELLVGSKQRYESSELDLVEKSRLNAEKHLVFKESLILYEELSRLWTQVLTPENSSH